MARTTKKYIEIPEAANWKEAVGFLVAFWLFFLFKNWKKTLLITGIIVLAVVLFFRTPLMKAAGMGSAGRQHNEQQKGETP